MLARQLTGKWLYDNCDRRVLRGGDKLSTDDTLRVIIGYALWCSILTDYPQCDSGRVNTWLRRNCTAANALRILRWMLHTDVVDVSSTFKQCKAILQKLPVNGSPRRVRNIVRLGMKDVKGCDTFKAMFSHLLVMYATDFEWTLAQHVNTLCTFISRLRLMNTEAYEAEAIEKYLENEEFTSHDFFGLKYYQYLPAIQEKVYEWLSAFEPSECISYQHSYGATAQVQRSRGTADKLQNFRLTDEASRVLRWMGFQVNPHLVPWAREYAIDVIFGFFGVDTQRPCDTVPAKYMTVPKGIDKRRGISMEDTTRAWLQKLVAEGLKRYMANKPIMRINLYDQRMNQVLAWLGSVANKYATIDLSDASDLIRWSVVQQVFALLPDLCMVIDHCRAKEVTIGSKTYRLTKHAPMGSALCFPVMCIILSAVIAVVLERRGVHDIYVVYGDDLVVPSIVFDEVCEVLTDMGLRVNRDKSFSTETFYKESCGIEAVKGRDITALKLSRKLDLFPDPDHALNDEEGQLEGYTALVNSLHAYGYTKTRKSVLRLLRSNYTGVVFTHNVNFGIFTSAENLDNSHLKRRKVYRYAEAGTTSPDRNGPYFYEYKVQAVKSCTRRGPDDLNYALKLERMQFRPPDYTPTPEDRGDVRSGRSKSTLKWIWVPQRLLESSS